MDLSTIKHFRHLEQDNFFLIAGPCAIEGREMAFEIAEKLVGYGEYPNIEGAFSLMADDYLAGGRDYKDVYGILIPKYYTGSSECVSDLDHWVYKGSTFEAFIELGVFICVLKGYEDHYTPEGYEDRAMKGETLRFEQRGYTYEMRPSRFPNGEMGCLTKIVASPTDKRRGSDPWMYEITKTGKGATLLEAINNAFASESEERLG